MDRINFKQFLMILFLVTVAGKMFMLPSYIMRLCGQDSMVVMIIDCVIDVIMLVVVIMIMRSATGTFFETLTYAFGKVVAKAIAAVLVVFYLIKLFNLLAEVRAFFSTTVLGIPMSPLHLAPLLLILLFVAGKKMEVLGRASAIVAPLVIVSMVMLGGLSLPSVNFSNLLPLFQEPGKIAKGLMSFPMWFGDYLLLLLFTGKTETRKRMYFALIASAVAIGFILLFTSMMFSFYAHIPDVLTYGHNISGMTQYSVASFQYGRFDLLIFCIWTLGVLTTASLMMTMVVRCINFTVGKDVGLLSGATCCVLLLAAESMFDNVNKSCEFMMQYLSMPGIIIQNAFPIVLLAAVRIRKLIESKKKRSGGEYEQVQTQLGL